MNIGILSDTHGILRENVIQELKKCDYIIHAGDIGTEKCYQQIKNLNLPTYYVKGNCDHGKWAAYLPENLIFPIGGHLFYLIHNVNNIPFHGEKECEFIISGHTHRYSVSRRGRQVFLNPGSVSQDRSGLGATMMLLHLDADSYEIEQVLLSR